MTEQKIEKVKALDGTGRVFNKATSNQYINNEAFTDDFASVWHTEHGNYIGEAGHTCVQLDELTAHSWLLSQGYLQEINVEQIKAVTI